MQIRIAFIALLLSACVTTGGGDPKKARDDIARAEKMATDAAVSFDIYDTPPEQLPADAPAKVKGVLAKMKDAEKLAAKAAGVLGKAGEHDKEDAPKAIAEQRKSYESKWDQVKGAIAVNKKDAGEKAAIQANRDKNLVVKGMGTLKHGDKVDFEHVKGTWLKAYVDHGADDAGFVALCVENWSCEHPTVVEHAQLAPYKSKSKDKLNPPDSYAQQKAKEGAKSDCKKRLTRTDCMTSTHSCSWNGNLCESSK